MNPSPCVIILLCMLTSAATVLGDSFLDAGLCALINCGEGTCKPTNVPFPPVHCECNSGWKEPQLGNLTFPVCIPNCTLNFTCDGSSPPAPPSPLMPINLNFSDPCAWSWCNEGKCVAQESGHICQCNEGADNLMNQDSLPCFKECVFGADCKDVGFGVQPPPPNGSNRNGLNGALNSASTPQCLLMLLVVAMFVPMF